MDLLSFRETQICEPQYPEMQDWLNGISILGGTGIPCDDLTPSRLKASDGTSAINIIVEWRGSFLAEYYVLERADGKGPSFHWDVIENKLRDIDYCDKGECRYRDKKVKPGLWYSYRVKACANNNVCSKYTNSAAGYRRKDKPYPFLAPVNNLLLRKNKDNDNN